MLPDSLPYMKWDEEVARQLTDFNKRLQHLERLEDQPEGGWTEGASVFHDAVQLLVNGVQTPLLFNSEYYDTDGIHSIVLNTTRLTCQTAGVYAIGGCCAVEPNAAGSHNSWIRLNGGIFIADDTKDATQTANKNTWHNPYTQWKLVVGDFVEFVMRNQSGVNLNTMLLLPRCSRFFMHKIGTG